MDYLLKRLPKGEKVLAKTRKTPLIFLRELLFAVILGGTIAGIQIGFKISQDIMNWVYVGAAAFLMLTGLQSLIKFSSVLVVTTNKFMYKKYVIIIKVFDTMLYNVDGVEVRYPDPVRRLLNVGHLVLRTRNSEYVIKNLARPDMFAAKLDKQASLRGSNNNLHISFGVAGAKAAPAAGEGQKIAGDAKQPVNN